MPRAAQGRTSPPISDYALVGNCRTAALFSRDGALEWLCLPRFDSASVFAAMLDRQRGGTFRVGPRDEARIERTYVDDTTVLQTVFRTDSGVLRLTDFMPVCSEEDRAAELIPEHEVIRIVECLEGEVAVEVECAPRPDYGKRLPRAEPRGAHGLFFSFRDQAIALASEIPLQPDVLAGSAAGSEILRAGERRRLCMTYARDEPMVLPVLGEEVERKLERTLRWWRAWAGRCRYEGPFRNAVVRSALTLKMLTYAPSGAILAAPTTSLPEEVGGERNWDYRYCWLRDASSTLGAFLDLGYRTESHAFFEWLMYATALTQPRIQVLYDVYGESRIPESEIDRLAGYMGSRPVRVGNAAANQLQLDIYGELVAAAHRFVRDTGELDPSEGKLLAGFGEAVCDLWKRPDEGIWEPRSGPQHHTYSKAMCWVALDRLLDLHRREHLKAPAERFAKVREEIREEIETRGYSEELKSYTTILDGTDVDASLLLLTHYGYCSGESERFRNTFRRIQESLTVKDALLYRYRERDDGLSGNEGTFGLCSFWAVESLVHMGRHDEAAARFQTLMGYANDVGLFAEEIQPDDGSALGNFPQAFTHLGVVRAACAMQGAGTERDRKGGSKA